MKYKIKLEKAKYFLRKKLYKFELKQNKSWRKKLYKFKLKKNKSLNKNVNFKKVQSFSNLKSFQVEKNKNF